MTDKVNSNLKLQNSTTYTLKVPVRTENDLLSNTHHDYSTSHVSMIERLNEELQTASYTCDVDVSMSQIV